MTENKRVKNRRDTAVNWTTNNPVLLAGEFGVEMDTRKLKVGDGVTAWNDLEYCSGYTEEEITAIITNTTYTKDEIDSALDNKADANDVYTKTEVDNIKSEIEGEIPTVNDSTVNIYQGGTLKGSFTLNQSSGETINLDAGGVSSVDWDDITDKPNFASVATSGEYSDLLHRPEIPTVGDGTITIKQGNVTKGTFTTNQSGDTTIIIDEGGQFTQQQSDWTEADTTSPSYIQHKPSIPTATSDLTNDSGFVTSSDVPTATSDLTNDSGFITLNDVPAQVNADWNSNSGVSQILNKPSIPTNTSDLNNDSGFITISDVPAQVNADWNSNSGASQILNKPTIPTKTSDLTNDSGFVTSSDVPTATSDLTNDSGFITLSDVPAQAQADWTEADPASPSYIQHKPSIPSGQVQSDWNQSDSSQVDYIKNKPTIPTKTSDLTNDSNFITSSDIPAQVQSDWSENDSTSPAYIANKPSIPAAQVNSDWNSNSGVSQILNKPTIPTKTSDITNDSGFVTSSDVPTKTSDLTNDSGFITLSDVPAQEQADWNEADSTDPSYIQNKPTVYTEWFGTQAQYDAILVKDSNTIYHIEGPAPVQSNWNESDNTSLAYIQNKPTIPAAQVNSDWNANSGVAQILNKPTIPTATSDLTNDSGFITSSDVPTATSDLTNDSGFITLSDVPAQVNADWNSSTGASQILNKPSIPTVNDATLTINQGGVLKGTFTANASSNVTIDLDGGGGTQVQSDWNQSDSAQVDYIKNKPQVATANVLEKPVKYQVNGSGTNKIICIFYELGVCNVINQLINDISASQTIVPIYLYVKSDGRGVNPAKYPQTTIWFKTKLINDNNVHYFTFNVNDQEYTIDGDVYSNYGCEARWSGDTQLMFNVTQNDNLDCLKFRTEVLAYNLYLSFDSYQIVSGKNRYGITANFPLASYFYTKSFPYVNINTDSGYTENLIQYIKWGNIEDRPTIPTVSDATITFTQGGTTKGTITLNQSGDATIALDAGGGGTQVQSDWNQSDNTAVDFIKNKPTIPAAQIQSDWNQSDNTAVDYIKNKPTIPAAQVQSNWNESDSTSAAYIQNKPSIPTIPSYTTETWTFTLSDQSTVTKTVYLVPSV